MAGLAGPPKSALNFGQPRENDDGAADASDHYSTAKFNAVRHRHADMVSLVACCRELLRLAPSRSQAFPSRPISYRSCRSPPGVGHRPSIARSLRRACISALRSVPVVIDTAGRHARTGANLVANSEPDGYTWLLTTSSLLVIAPFIGGRPAYDSLKDFAPITLNCPSARPDGRRAEDDRSPSHCGSRRVLPNARLAKYPTRWWEGKGSGVGDRRLSPPKCLNAAAGFDMLYGSPNSGTG